MTSDPTVKALLREAKRSRRLPPGAVCVACGGTASLSKTRAGEIRCYEHLTTTAPFEVDHIAGRANLAGLTAALRPNAHRVVTDMRIDLGKDDWPIAHGDPLFAVGHALAGFASLLWLIAKWLIDLGLWLHVKLGETWWEGAPLSPFAL